MRIPRSFSGATQLAGAVLDDPAPESLWILHPEETGLPSLFGPPMAELAVEHLDYARYLHDRETAPEGSDG